MRQSAEMENMMTSVERIQEYGKLESEAPLETKDGKEVNIIFFQSHLCT